MNTKYMLYNLVDDIQKYKLKTIEFKIIKINECGSEFYEVKYLVPHKRIFRKISYIWITLAEDHGYDYVSLKTFSTKEDAEATIKILTNIRTTTIVSHFTVNIQHDTTKSKGRAVTETFSPYTPLDTTSPPGGGRW